MKREDNSLSWNVIAVWLSIDSMCREWGKERDRSTLAMDNYIAWLNRQSMRKSCWRELISTWINPPSLRRNFLDCVECLGERKKHLLNLNLGEMIALLETLCCLVCWSLSWTCWGWGCWTSLDTWEDGV